MRMLRNVALLGISLLAAGVFPSCSERHRLQDPAGERLLKERKERDTAFRSSPQSPIPAADRAKFSGLEYYPPNPALQFQVTLKRYPRPAPIRMATNTGEVRSGLKYGFFEFAVAGVPCRLQVYRLDDDDGRPSLFIPFRDATTGTETYSGGRYLDLAENTTGVYELDFNRAYNPSCAYGGDFSCPVPPDENRLAVAIHAGEKGYSTHR